MNILEKYRPQSWDEVIGQDEVVRKLKWLEANPQFQLNILFVGPDGVGKKSCANLAKNMTITIPDQDGITRDVYSDFVVFRFRPVPDDVIYPLILKICQSEGITPPSIINAHGSIKRAILSLFEPPVVVDTTQIINTLKTAASGDFNGVLNELGNIVSQGWDPLEIANVVMDYLISNPKLHDPTRLHLIRCLGEFERNVKLGCDPLFQLKCFYAEICLMKNGGVK